MNDSSTQLPYPVGADLLRQAYREHVIAKRVELGIRYLSNSYGGATGLDWLSKVRVSEVDMGSNSSCILGQVTGDYATSPLFIMLGIKYASAWGFYLTADDMNEGLTYEMLTDAWQKRLRDLQRKRAEALLKRASAGLDDSWYEEADA